jgi:hypothetical protein
MHARVGMLASQGWISRPRSLSECSELCRCCPGSVSCSNFTPLTQSIVKSQVAYLVIRVLHKGLPDVVLLEDSDLDNLSVAFEDLVDVLNIQIVLVVIHLHECVCFSGCRTYQGMKCQD